MTDLNGLRGAVLCDPASGSPVSPALDASVLAVRSAILALTSVIQAQTDITALFVVDSTSGKYYVRRESLNEGTNAVTVSFLNLDGSVPGTAPAVANLTPLNASAGAAAGISPVTTFFDVATAATGYAVGDSIARVIFLNTSTNAITAAAWYNVTQGTSISAPTAANIKEIDQNTVVSGAVALLAGTAIIGKVGIDQTTPGTTNGVAVNQSALPSGAATDANLNARLGISGQKTMAGSNPSVIASDQTPIPTARGLYYTPQQIAASLAASASISTPDRDAGPAPSAYAFYTVFVRSDQACVVNIFAKPATGSSSFVAVLQQSVPANTPTFIKVPLAFRSYAAQLVNSSTAATAVTLTDSYTAA